MNISIVSSDLHYLNLNKAKLKAVNRTSTLFSGFAMVALVEMSIEVNNDLNSDIPSLVLHLFTIVTCLLIGVHLLALMISTCLLPHIETITDHDTLPPPLTTTATIGCCNIEDNNNKQNDANNKQIIINNNDQQQQQQHVVQSSPIEHTIINIENNNDEIIHISDISSFHNNNISKKKSFSFFKNSFNRELPLVKFQPYIELSWLLSNGVGIFLFLIQVLLVCYIKFYPMTNAKNVFISGWTIIAIILLLFILFSYKFYRLLIHYQLKSKRKDISMLNKELISLANLTANNKKNESNDKSDKTFSRIFPFRSKSIDDNLLVNRDEREFDYAHQSTGKQHLLTRVTTIR